MATIPTRRRPLHEVATGEVQVLAIDRRLVPGDAGQCRGTGPDAVDRYVVWVTVDAVGVVVDDRFGTLSYAQISHPARERPGVRAHERLRVTVRRAPGHAGVAVAEELEARHAERSAGRLEFGQPLCRRATLLARGGGDQYDTSAEGREPAHRDAGEYRFVVGVGVQEDEAASGQGSRGNEDHREVLGSRVEKWGEDGQDRQQLRLVVPR